MAHHFQRHTLLLAVVLVAVVFEKKGLEGIGRKVGILLDNN